MIRSLATLYDIIALKQPQVIVESCALRQPARS
jgi:hypothetical protein